MTQQKQKDSRWEIDVTRTMAKRLGQSVSEDSSKVADSSSAGALARGRLFALSSYHDRAIESYRESLALDPTQHEAAARLVLLYIRTGQPSLALATAMKLAADAPKYELREMTSEEKISVFTLLGNALVQNDRIDDAIQAYEVAQRTSKADTTAPARLAQLYLATGQPKKAIEQTEAFAGNPRFRDLASVLILGKTNAALLPAFRRDRLIDALALSDHGRPLTLGNTVRVAPAIADEGAWCGDVAAICGRGAE